MGIDLYLLGGQTAKIIIAGYEKRIGRLKRLCKLSEMTAWRGAEIERVKESWAGCAAPAAVMIEDFDRIPIWNEPDHAYDVHLVLGWEKDRTSVIDAHWDYLPVLGYAVESCDAPYPVLHEESGGLLYPVTLEAAIADGILNAGGKLERRGQFRIRNCRSVRPHEYYRDRAVADVMLWNGKAAEIWTEIEPGCLPQVNWYAGKRPSDVKRYMPALDATSLV